MEKTMDTTATSTGVATAEQPLQEALAIYRRSAENENLSGQDLSRIAKCVVQILSALAAGYSFEVFDQAVSQASRWHPRSDEAQASFIDPMVDPEVKERFWSQSQGLNFRETLLLIPLDPNHDKLAKRILAPVNDNPTSIENVGLVIRRIKHLFDFEGNDLYDMVFRDDQTRICEGAPARWIAVEGSLKAAPIISCSHCRHKLPHNNTGNPTSCSKCNKPIQNGGPENRPDGL